MQLPIECIEAILAQLDKTTYFKDLTALLTVNRAFFEASAKHIYANPFEVLKHLGRDSGQKNTLSLLCYLRPGKPPVQAEQAARGLLALILRHSPAQDPHVQLLRARLSEDLEALPERPMVDYVSLIRTIQLDQGLFGPHSALANYCSLDNSNDSQTTKLTLHDTLTWAICGHRLSQVLDIEISWDDSLDRYHSQMDDMALARSIRLQTLDIPLGPISRWDKSGKEAVDRGLASVLRFMEKWAAAYNKRGRDRRQCVEIQLVNYTPEYWWADESYAPLLTRIFELMPMLTLTEMQTRNALQCARMYLAPETVAFSHVHTCVVVVQWSQTDYIATILQRLRSLRRLELFPNWTIEPALFDWAVQERREATAALRSTHVKTIHPLVPLSELYLILNCMVPWEPAIYAFGMTLTTVKITHNLHSYMELSVFHDLPVLRHLELDFGYIARGASTTGLSECPQIETLTMHGEFMTHPPYDQWVLSQVKDFCMNGQICHQFDQDTLKTMIRVESMTWNNTYEDEAGDDPNPDFIWHMHIWTQASFPVLRRFVLGGGNARGFQWEMLLQCPVLQELELAAFWEVGEQPVLQWESWSRPWAVRPTLHTLRLYGFAIPDRTLFDHLALAVPNLRTLVLNACIKLDTDEQEALLAKFPQLDLLDYVYH